MELDRQPPISFGTFAIITEDNPEVYIEEREIKNKLEFDTLLQELGQYNNAHLKDVKRKLIRIK